MYGIKREDYDTIHDYIRATNIERRRIDALLNAKGYFTEGQAIFDGNKPRYSCRFVGRIDDYKKFI